MGNSAYQNLYIVEPGTSMVVEAMPDPVGLKMGVIVGINMDLQELIYQRFQCKNEAIFNISEITGEDISFYGGQYVINLSGHDKKTPQHDFNIDSNVIHISFQMLIL